ncbi:MAG: hypothetical protein HN909_03275 [Phycisphaerales bacterium]|jgi:hypothetical protein|nr:hypothetical protein [Phycisphaerales bacterium]MBT7170773.1 hypothetical protein [Phycisphaerales bacterium]
MHNFKRRFNAIVHEKIESHVRDPLCEAEGEETEDMLRLQGQLNGRVLSDAEKDRAAKLKRRLHRPSLAYWLLGLIFAAVGLYFLFSILKYVIQ